MNSAIEEYEYQYTNDVLPHTHQYLAEPLLAMLRTIPNPDGKKLRVLDLGCGNGSISNFVAQQGYEVVGVEESGQGVAIAQAQFPNCHFRQGSLYELPSELCNHTFDVVMAVEVIEHLFYPKELARTARTCLKPDGKLIITTPYHGYFKNLLLAPSGKLDGHFHALWDGGHIKFFSIHTLSQLLQEEGFTDRQFKFAGRMPYCWKSMLCCSALAK
jgi:2-polyprenyl-3-methyl-5-hydroxy-6-metoxy-1,4-benzoquinol methylase